MIRRKFVAGLALAACLSNLAQAQDYPTKPSTMVVAAAEVAGAASGMLTAGPVRDYLTELGRSGLL